MSLTVPPLPRLLPQNRKIRHLRGIYLRNLTFSRPPEKSVDDTAISKSPGISEHRQLPKTRSSESLRTAPKIRRRSTNLAGASALTQQKALEIVVQSRAADSFFSLHCNGAEEPIYISELKEQSVNFNFQFFDLTSQGPHITRSPIVTVKIWTKRHGSWSLFIEEESDLRSLSYLQTLPGNHFPPNTIVFHLLDGAYAFGLKNKIVLPKSGDTLATSSYGALMKLANLETSFQDTLETKEKLSLQSKELLDAEAPRKGPEAEDHLQLVTKHLLHQRRNFKAAEKRRDELKASIKLRRGGIADGRALQERANVEVENASETIPSSNRLVTKTNDEIRRQRRRICEDLTNIFPITPTLSPQPLSFQICGLALPNSDFGTSSISQSTDEDALSAALGFVALLTNSLQYYLGVPLPYQITAFGSRSTIRDDISMLHDSQRDFPLHLPRGGSSAQYRFTYGWFLLNKDIEALCCAQGLKVVDIRHTLPNLKYLLYVCSAGTDELPERKKGGIRGLWAGRMHSRGFSLSVDGESSTGGSRRGSTDSELLAQQAELLKKSVAINGGGGGGGRGDVLGLTSPSSPLSLPFDGQETRLTLRTKGLRENVGS